MPLSQNLKNKADSQLNTVWDSLVLSQQNKVGRYIQLLESHDATPEDGSDTAISAGARLPSDRTDFSERFSDFVSGAICMSLKVDEYYRGESYKGFTLTAKLQIGNSPKQIYIKTLHSGVPEENYRAHDWKLLSEI